MCDYKICPQQEVLSRCELDDFDISGLALTRDNYLVSRDSTTFTMNVCRGLNAPAPCSPDTAICLRKGISSGIRYFLVLV